MHFLNPKSSCAVGWNLTKRDSNKRFLVYFHFFFFFFFFFEDASWRILASRRVPAGQGVGARSGLSIILGYGIVGSWVFRSVFGT